MALKDDFEKAAEEVKWITSRPDNDTLLLLYSLFKQATEGDVKGEKPGMFDLKGKKKFEAWESKKGKSKDAAMHDYIAAVKKLTAKN